MTSILKQQYGYCVAPKGTLLYRSHPTTECNVCMFFALRHRTAGGFNKRPAVQVWQTTADIEMLFAVESIDRAARVKCSLPQIDRSLFPEETALKVLNFIPSDMCRRRLFPHYV